MKVAVLLLHYAYITTTFGGYCKMFFVYKNICKYIYVGIFFFLPNLYIRPKNPGCHTLYCHSYSEQGIIRHTFSVLSQHVYQQSFRGFGNAWQNKRKIPKRQLNGKEASFIDQHLHPCTSSINKIFKPTCSSQWLDTHFIQRNTFQIRWFR